ncbi:hypothetical protein HK097_009377 [Rhizophlyctis rosea]|uniref:Uncharacterized protein n=1 Tax=Rhizophlyctis rosea TaxID=64517 RepID=A0AAD5SHA2_9FUNG|nr:hypothetical protein HK097_009377 [Rhizophlyctis rosea]
MSTGRLFLRRPELMKYWEVQPEIIKRIVEAEEPTHLNDIIPLSRNGDGFEMEAKEEILLKGRDAGDTATRAVIRERPLKYRGF